ncbi:hypothetical protein ACFE04_008196 [Oxalis oulophora]
MAKPAYTDGGELIDGGFDMTTTGICGYLHDIIYITCFVQVASIISDKFWYTYLVIPAYGAYHSFGFIKGFLSMPSSEGPEEDEKSRKKREKMEKKASRGKMFNLILAQMHPCLQKLKDIKGSKDFHSLRLDESIICEYRTYNQNSKDNCLSLPIYRLCTERSSTDARFLESSLQAEVLFVEFSNKIFWQASFNRDLPIVIRDLTFFSVLFEMRNIKQALVYYELLALSPTVKRLNSRSRVHDD